jgi:transcriptional regulator with XRE-family HTH domain
MSRKATRQSNRVRVDRAALWQTLDEARDARGLTWAQVAGEVGTSASTFSRLRRGDGTDADTFAAIVAWLGVSPSAFVHGARDTTRSAQLPRTLALLRESPALNAGETRLLDSVIAATVRGIQERRKPAKGKVR